MTRPAVVAILALALTAAPAWTVLSSGVRAGFRGVSVVSDQMAWASGTGDTVLRTTDGGQTWTRLTVTSDGMDFRDVDAINERVAYVLSIGPGARSRIYKTTDAGATWTPQFLNTDEAVFLDAMTFSDEQHGIVMGDSIDGKFTLLGTDNGGKTWDRIPAASLPPALPNEGAFAASGTNVAMFGSNIWIGTGAAAKSRVLRSNDRGKTWNVADTPLRAAGTIGIFSITFRDAQHGVVVGGNYQQESEAVDNVAVTSDGGVTWTLVTERGLSGFRSAVQYVPRGGGSLVAVGPQGADYSTDDGHTWTPIEGTGYHTFAFSPSGRIGFGAGARGSLGKLTMGK